MTEDNQPPQNGFWARLKERITTTQAFRSIFRHGYADTPRNRALQVASNVYLHLHPTRVARHGLRVHFTWCAGGLTFLAFLVLCITGVLLMFYYRPTVAHAYADIKSLRYDVPFGPVLRNMHRWAAHAMVILVMVHMLRVFLTGSYKPPREFNWVVGVFLLTLTLLLSFTGYLLPWDQLAYWAVTVGGNMAREFPFLGHEGPGAEIVGVSDRYDVRALLLGGRVVSESALLRFYVLHCILLPLVAGFLMALHFWRVRRDGGISGPL